MSAYLSECRRYRYVLTRDVAPLTGEGTVTFVMLNPSTADETADDRTTRRCMDFARRWGYARLNVVNPYAYRATDPRELRKVNDPVGPENDCTLATVFGGSDLTVAAWGARAEAERVADVMSWPMHPRVALGLTKDGAPRHPLYVCGDAQLIPYQALRGS